MMRCLQDNMCNILMWVTIYDPFASNLGFDDNWNWLDYPWIFIVPLPFFLYVESLLSKPKSSVFSYTDRIHIVIQQTRTAESEVLHTTLPNRPLTLLQNHKTTEYHKMWCPSDWYTTFGDSYLSTICKKLSLNPYNFNCCPSPRSQFYPPSKSCKILQHTDISVPRGSHSYAQTKGILKYLRWSHMQGQSWSTHFSVFHMSGPKG